MEGLTSRLNLFNQAIATLKDSLDKFSCLLTSDFYYNVIRDSIIQKFEYSIDAFWKLLKEYLEIEHGIDALGSPKLVIKTCADLKLISSGEWAILNKMINDRNMTSHAYNEFLAEEIAKSIPTYYDIMQLVAERITSDKV